MGIADELKKPHNAPPKPPPVPGHNLHLHQHQPAPTLLSSTPPPASQAPSTTSIVGLKKQNLEPGRSVELNGHVGFDSLPHQLVKKCVEAGFQFNLMCVGETGMGKTTLIESLFNMKLDFQPCNNELKTVELRTKTYDVAEGGVRVKLRLVETAGFGDQLDKDKSAQVIVDYLEAQFERYLQEELKVRRMLAYMDDTRIHACLYFISPTGHGLKALDIVTLRELAKRVNVIPVIAKADTTCKDELSRFKAKIMSELRSNNINIYQFPTDDETVAQTNAEMNRALPFAVIGSGDFIRKENGQLVRARRYPWGIVEVENEEHCDFVKLREALLRTNVDAMREKTHNVLYENYRRERLRSMRLLEGEGPKLIESIAARQKEFNDDYAQREMELREHFHKELEKKEHELRGKEEQLTERDRSIEGYYPRELLKLESEIRALREEKTKLLAKMARKFKK